MGHQTWSYQFLLEVTIKMNKQIFIAITGSMMLLLFTFLTIIPPPSYSQIQIPNETVVEQSAHSTGHQHQQQQHRQQQQQEQNNNNSNNMNTTVEEKQQHHPSDLFMFFENFKKSQTDRGGDSSSGGGGN